MRFNIDYDLGHLVRGWVVPDNPVAISRVFVTVDGRRVAEVASAQIDDAIRSNGWHSTGQCVFEVTEAVVPDLASVRRLEIYDADTNILVYRRASRDGLVQGRLLLINTSIEPETAIQAALFEHFQQSYFGIGRFSEEVMRVVLDSHWLTSSFLSGAVIYPRYEGSLQPDRFLTALLVHDPYVEMATRLLWLRAKAAEASDPARNWRLGPLAVAAEFATDYDFEDIKALKRLFRMMPEPAYHLLYNPLTRQFGTKLPDDRLRPGNSIVAIEILARVGIVGHRDFYAAFVATLFDRLGINAEVPVPDPIPTAALALAARLRSLKVAQEMVVFDVAMADAVRNAVSKGWTL